MARRALPLLASALLVAGCAASWLLERGEIEVMDCAAMLGVMGV